MDIAALVGITAIAVAPLPAIEAQTADYEDDSGNCWAGFGFAAMLFSTLECGSVSLRPKLAFSEQARGSLKANHDPSRQQCEETVVLEGSSLTGAHMSLILYDARIADLIHAVWSDWRETAIHGRASHVYYSHFELVVLPYTRPKEGVLIHLPA